MCQRMYSLVGVLLTLLGLGVLPNGWMGFGLGDAQAHESKVDNEPAVVMERLRFAAVSERFELVGEIDGKHVLLFLDHFSDNRPVRDAQITLELQGREYQVTKLAGEQEAQGTFETMLAEHLPSGMQSITVRIRADGADDVLVAELDVHEHDNVHMGSDGKVWLGWRWLAAGLLMLGLALFYAIRRRKVRPLVNRVSMIMAGLVCSLLALPPSAQAHGDEPHDHGDKSASHQTAKEKPDGAESASYKGMNRPQRLTDGSIVLPKPVQRQFGLRTQVVELQELPRTVVLNGQVLMDPNAGGRVQPMRAGRIEPGPQGLPMAGQQVKKGQVLAYVAPAISSVDQAAQSAQLAELRAAKALTEKRYARLKALTDIVPRKDVEAAESELVSLSGRIAAIERGLSGREALVAPVAGVIASAQVVAGQVVDARELLFEIVDPQRLRIEALAFDPALAGNIGSASLLVGNESMPLTYLGAARRLREQALPLNFQLKQVGLTSLAVGQPVKVYIQTKQTIRGAAVPMAAFMKNPSNQTIVWVKTAPEQFEPRVVTFESLDGAQAVVTSGLQAADRVVTQAATLINQIR